MSENKFDFKEFRKIDKKISNTEESKRTIILQRWVKDIDVNKRSVAAKYGYGLDELSDDENFDVQKTVARYSAKYSEKLARTFFDTDKKGKNKELRTMAALSLSECNMLTDKEIENLETPILRLLIKNRSSMMQIAKIHKVGEIKNLMNEELNIMSRRENLDVTDLRNEVNSQPFLFGDYMYKLDMEFDDEDDSDKDEASAVELYIKQENEKEEQNKQFEQEEPVSDEDKPLSLDEILAKL